MAKIDDATLYISHLKHLLIFLFDGIHLPALLYIFALSSSTSHLNQVLAVDCNVTAMDLIFE